ncbi:MAG: hypothetical protein ACLTOV_10675 [Phocaeicola sp.]
MIDIVLMNCLMKAVPAPCVWSL